MFLNVVYWLHANILISLIVGAISLTYLAILNTVRMLGIAMIMMASTTLGLNQLPNHLISHGTAINNTFRQISGSLGTAALVTVMITSDLDNGTAAGQIHGVNTDFLVSGCISIVGLLLALMIKNPQQQNRKASE
ncbi:hypothetical protein CSV67_10155 [Sporosarcina sp. P2]|uniref:hypothetical protein n=1 Tax=Sporosarcina sp. P2 TaxID=2048251 RepID=UPI000C1637C6|nr:hypothetical protein [Sporosarcina sp. P2]PID02316.1 hypothetical protein CSV67_10155 [Sporosarcina sp. P2]